MGKSIDLIGQTFGYLKVLYKSDTKVNGRPAWVCKCLRCGNIHITNAYLLRSGSVKSCGCLRADNWRASQDKITMEAKERHTIDLLDRRFDKLTVTRYIGDDKWECKCDCGNIVVRARHTLLYGNINKHSCTTCGQALPFLANIQGKIINNLEVLSYDTKLRKWLCKCILCGNTRYVSAGDIYKTKTCGCANTYRDGSSIEQEIYNYIGIPCDKHRRDLLGNSQEIDLYYSDYNVGIEVNGSIFHATLNSPFTNKPKKYHNDKFLNAKHNNIHLISIFDVDWKNNQGKIKAYLDHIFKSANDTRVYARKCDIRLVDKKDAMKFFDMYHIQGRTVFSTINYGLYYDNELISVMGFGKLRLQKQSDGNYELHRYCIKDGVSVIGGANKLLKAFERDYSPKNILSYSDNDYFVGSVYSKLGFKYIRQVTPRYYWCYGDIYLTRERCQLKILKVKYPKLYDEAISNNVNNKEDFIMTQLGFCKIYRSGNTRWEKTRGNNIVKSGI